MKYCFVSAILSLVFVASIRANPSCLQAVGDDNEVRELNGICYEFIDSKTTYDFAMLFCHAKDGMLPLFVDMETQDFIIKTANTDLNLDWDTAYMGIWKETGKGPWYDPFGETLTYTNWGDGEGMCTLPFEAFCLRNFAALNFRTRTWEDALNIDLHYHMCQYGIPHSLRKDCPFSEKDPHVKEFNGNCYEFFNTKLSHKDASKYCVRNGGRLADIKNKETEDFLIQTIKSFNDIMDWAWNSFHISAFRNDGSKPWFWSNFDRVQYSNWGESYCGPSVLCFEKCAIFKLSIEKWDDILCTGQHYVICQYNGGITKTEIVTNMTELEINRTYTSSSATVTVGLIYTICAAVTASFASTVFVYQIYMRGRQIREIKTAINQGYATQQFWEANIAEYYNTGIQEFDDAKQCRECCLNIPPECFQRTIR